MKQQIRNKGFIVTENRLKKAMKIESVICHHTNTYPIKNKKILDIGCGSGEIVSYFSNRNQAYACDVNNQLSDCIDKKIHFSKITSTLLPYENNFFDVVISNHVIEHVNNQLNHLKEISRVLKPSGICFFSTPNRFFPIEPHYKIPLLHYLPDTAFIYLLKKFGLYHEDLKLLSHTRMKKLFKATGFNHFEYTANVLKYPDSYHWDGPSLRNLPFRMIGHLQFLSQTNIFILTLASHQKIE